MIYNTATGVVQGVSYSCYQSLGIPSSLVYGINQSTNDFTIDQIMQDICYEKNIDELQSPLGLIATIDTSYI